MLFSGAGKLFENIYIFTWDALLALVNVVTPNLKVGTVVPHGFPGADGKWPEFVAPKESDSRSCCPALNAMANHGILPHDGRNIKFTEMTETVRTTFNFAPSFCRFVPGVMADKLHRNYKTDTCDLADISLHNGIEHDASLTRQDFKFDPDQGKPYLPFIEDLLASATGKDEDGNLMLTAADLSRYSSKRRAEARATNPDFTLDKFHKLFGSANSSTLLTIFGGKVADLELILTEERIPEGWESRIRSRKGLTFLAFNRTVLAVEKGIKEETAPITEETALRA
ncbi:putative sterigmatocystin biosynthesis peroxidase stcC [Mycena venus]|uniref:Putative sterigmatocystin biosynthesis peroxidase stcC n=1 Tax=Mycena venus TaxID=2733690 RepID=A0A8H6XLR9_9AGAR|nr:putative sterigmatocystin biosynthesis peroxidase stcC [Mycena venus]